MIISLSVKQNLKYIWFLRPSALGKLILNGNLLSIKQNLGHAWILGPRTLGKLIPVKPLIHPILFDKCLSRALVYLRPCGSHA